MIDGIGMNQAALARPTHSAQHPNNAGQAGNQAAQAGQAAYAQPAQQAQAQQAQAATQAQANGQLNGQGAGVSTSPHVAQPVSTTQAPSAHEAAFSPQGVNATPPTQATAMPLAGGQVNGAPQADDAPRWTPTRTTKRTWARPSCPTARCSPTPTRTSDRTLTCRRKVWSSVFGLVVWPQRPEVTFTD